MDNNYDRMTADYNSYRENGQHQKGSKQQWFRYNYEKVKWKSTLGNDL
jgi:hypothetical protein